MPVSLSNAASAKYAALVASSGLTAQIRTLAPAIKEACKDGAGAMNWADDLSALGIGIPAEDDKRETFARSLASAFGAVATQTVGDKRGANVRFLEVEVEVEVDGETLAETTIEVAVSFRKVNTRK